MSKLRLMSVLQSRIAKRRKVITETRTFANTFHKNSPSYPYCHMIADKHGELQKEDKQILKQLIEDERSIKEWKARFDTSSKALRIIDGMSDYDMRDD